MRLVVTGRHVDITPTLRQLVDRKLAKLDRLFGEALVSAQIVLTREKNRRTAELVVHTRGDHMLHGSGDQTSWAASVTAAVAKVVQQAKKIKGKWQERKRHATAVKTVAARTVAVPERLPRRGPRIVRAARAVAKPMTVEEAALDVSTATDGVLVFRNSTSGSINVLYLRKNGEIGLIEA
jgi:putative sigma-54 modulation protein